MHKNKYFLLLTDEFSAYRWVIQSRTKTEASQKLLDLLKKLEKHQQGSLKFFHADNGKEFVNENVRSFLRNKGIALELSMTSTPGQNGVAERSNRTVLDGM